MSGKKIGRWLFVCYTVLMLWLLFGQRIGEGRVGMYNLQPFRTIRGFWWLGRHSRDTEALLTVAVNLAGNVIMFIPLGFLLPLGWKRFRSFFVLLGAALCIICAVEVLQYYCGLGSMDIDDLILNLPGTLIGYGLWRLIAKGSG